MLTNPVLYYLLAGTAIAALVVYALWRLVADRFG